MTSNEEDNERDAQWEARYPLIDQDAEPPGKWVVEDASADIGRWEGQSGWRTRYGQAEVFWSHGQPKRVKQALYPDGTRGDVIDTIDFGHRRPGTGQRLWIYGDIEVRPDDVVFVDGEQPVYFPPPQSDEPNLEADFAVDDAFLEALQDRRFALALGCTLANRDLHKNGDPRSWYCGDRKAARLLAQWRNRGESYQDFFMDILVPEHRHNCLTRDFHELESVSLEIESIESSATQTAVDSQPLPNDVSGETPGQNAPIIIIAGIQRLLGRPDSMEIDNDPDSAINHLKRLKDLRSKLENARRTQLEELLQVENGDMLIAVHEHLIRLGWRMQNSIDIVRFEREAFEKRIALLQEIKRLEARPERPMQAWAEAYRETQERPYDWEMARPYTLVSATDEQVQAMSHMLVQTRLISLAVNGQVSEAEFQPLWTQLQKARFEG